MMLHKNSIVKEETFPIAKSRFFFEKIISIFLLKIFKKKSKHLEGFFFENLQIMFFWKCYFSYF